MVRSDSQITRSAQVGTPLAECAADNISLHSILTCKLCIISFIEVRPKPPKLWTNRLLLLAFTLAGMAFSIAF